MLFQVVKRICLLHDAELKKIDLNDKHSHFVNAFIFAQQKASSLSLVLVNRKIYSFVPKMRYRCVSSFFYINIHLIRTHNFKRVGVFCRIQTNKSLLRGLFC